jgi:CheY-like chemotaxis protein
MDAVMDARNDSVNQPTLLIIDDDMEWTEVLKLFFGGKYEVKVVNSAREALDIARSCRPSVIIVDLVMPSVDGFGVIHRLNDSGERPVPTILVTGWKTAEVEECAAAVGCAAVLPKPVDLDALAEVVSSAMKGSLAAQQAA